MQKDRTTADHNDHKPPRMGPALAHYADAYFSGGVRYNPTFADLLHARIQQWGPDLVAAQAREMCERHAGDLKGA